MTQSIVGLPEKAKIKIRGFNISIKNHKVTGPLGFLDRMLWLIREDRREWENAVSQMQAQQISFDTMIDTCACELDNDYKILGRVIAVHYNFEKEWNITDVNTGDDSETFKRADEFSKDISGREIAEKIIDEIRDCVSWDHFLGVMNTESVFSHGIKKLIRKEVIKWYKI